jgi:hypothetical protein
MVVDLLTIPISVLLTWKILETAMGFTTYQDKGSYDEGKLEDIITNKTYLIENSWMYKTLLHDVLGFRYFPLAMTDDMPDGASPYKTIGTNLFSLLGFGLLVFLIISILFNKARGLNWLARITGRSVFPYIFFTFVTILLVSLLVFYYDWRELRLFKRYKMFCAFPQFTHLPSIKLALENYGDDLDNMPDKMWTNITRDLTTTNNWKNIMDATSECDLVIVLKDALNQIKTLKQDDPSFLFRLVKHHYCKDIIIAFFMTVFTCVIAIRTVAHIYTQFITPSKHHWYHLILIMMFWSCLVITVLVLLWGIWVIFRKMLMRIGRSFLDNGNVSFAHMMSWLVFKHYDAEELVHGLDLKEEFLNMKEIILKPLFMIMVVSLLLACVFIIWYEQSRPIQKESDEDQEEQNNIVRLKRYASLMAFVTVILSFIYLTRYVRSEYTEYTWFGLLQISIILIVTCLLLAYGLRRLGKDDVNDVELDE